MSLFTYPRRALVSLLVGFVLHLVFDTRAQELPRAVLPKAVVDLRTREGVDLVRGTWRYHDADITRVDHRDVGADLKASGAPNQTADFVPDARGPGFDDYAWESVEPTDLEGRRGHGRLSLGWYRIRVTLPEAIRGWPVRGSTVVLELVMDDYAEIWVNGRLPYVLGQNGGTVAAGWNAPNRVVLTEDARPGDGYEIAVLGINGPLSTHPDTYLWVRGATLDFHEPGALRRRVEVPLVVDHRSAEAESVLGDRPRLERVASGFAFTEGPVWIRGGTQRIGPEAAEGHLLFSDPNNNLVYRLSSLGDVSVVLPKSGYSGTDIGVYRQPGSNGLAVDGQDRLTLCQHGHRRVVRLEKNGQVTVLADRFEGKRLNSPNDLVYRRDGTLYFTDPPFGLPSAHRDPRRELDFAGVYSVRDGVVRCESKELSGPNGLAFSPDERWLYVGNWDEKRKVVLRYPVLDQGALGPSSVFADLTQAPGDDAIDGIKVDEAGHVYVSGPGGLWILDAAGDTLALVRAPENVHNLAWGDA
ncbi:MAG: SMP-30/gluconolactonase/LRE family protein, partial [Verrucomicrobiales bacterium]|nr:SMP-30/gluconolactonase/LRE family protein [Verrucomicrobiales bacterium]